MARKLFVLLFPLLLIVLVPTVNAVNSTTGSAQATAKKQLQDQKKIIIMQTKNASRAANIQAAREEFKIRLQAIKDAKKKLLVERIDARIEEVNTKTLDRFTDVLNKLQTFVDRIGTPSAGPVVLADIAAAQKAIDTARAAVDIQAAKIYTINITDDTTLKVNVGKIVSQFRKDLVTVHKLVVNAKQAVQKLNTDKVLIKKEATGSAKL